MPLRYVYLAILGAIAITAQSQPALLEKQKGLTGRTDLKAMEEWTGILTDLHLSHSPELRNVVQRLRLLKLYDNETWIMAVNTGYAYLSDGESARRFRAELARERPDSSWAVQAAVKQWESTHPPLNTEAAGFNDWAMARLALLRRLHAEKPHSEAATAEYLQTALTLEPRLQTEEALAVADLALRSKQRRFYNSQIAEIYLRHRARLDQVPSLLNEDLEQLKKEYRASLSSGSRIDLANFRLISRQLRVHTDLAEYWLQKGDIAQGRAAAAKASADLRRLEPAPEGESSQRSIFEIQRKQFLRLASRLDSDVQSLPKVHEADWSKVYTQPLSEFQAVDLNGRRWSLQDWKGKLVLVNMWATWCGPCRAELPFIEKLQESFHGRPDRLVISINVDADPELARRVVREHHYSFPVINSRQLADIIDFANGVPQNRIVDRQGHLLLEPIDGDGEALVANVQEVLSRMN